MGGIGGSVRGIGLAAVLAVAACGGPPERAQVAKPIDTRQCLRQLDRLDGLVYRRLADRTAAPTCGLRGAVEVRNIGVVVNGIGPLSCAMTARLHDWIHEGLQPAARDRFGSEVVAIESYGTYACRPRNNMAGAQPSEHSWANAIDIAGFRLADGRRISVLRDWNGSDKRARKFLRDLREAGCERFNLVLGPDDNAQHRDHLHFDMGRWDNCR
jgi:hypothetical protein